MIVDAPENRWRSLWAHAPADLRRALGFLTILPVGNPEGAPVILPTGVAPPEERRPGHAFAWFPLVGLLIGALLALAAWLLADAPLLRGVVVVTLWVVVTGALHLDGWGDSCDGLLATVAPERRLEIMKDPRAGSWAVVGIVLLLLIKVAAVASMPVHVALAALVVAPVAGRWAMTAAAWAFPYARMRGIGAYFRDGLGAPQRVVASVTALLVVAAASFWAPPMLVAALVAPVVAFGGGRWAAGRLGGGLTGDVYGAICEGTEALCLLILALLVAA
jgi:adenosylcobinamide-GDP ribazoletransferase